MQSIKSPVTGRTNVEIIDTIPTPFIAERYKRYMNMDVARFFDGVDAVSICQCRESGMRFYDPMRTAGDDLFYQELQEKEQYYRTNRPEHRRALHYVQPDAKLLEIGVGTGFFLDLVQSKTKDLTGLELNTKAAAENRARGLNVVTELIEEHAEKCPETYDMVCSFQVLEHVPAVKSYIDASLKVLKKGGIMLIAVPNNNPYIHRYDKYDTMNMPPHHVGLWDKEAFAALPNFFPMKVVAIEVEPVMAYAAYAGAWVKNKFGYAIGDIATTIFLSKPVSPIIKLLLQPFLKDREGRNIMAVFQKI
jgi:2-polyprenyl-3-methyl-5-hydroxy-6-metoxy-1,4-benzoquinol methylase